MLNILIFDYISVIVLQIRRLNTTRHCSRALRNKYLPENNKFSIAIEMSGVAANIIDAF